MMPQKEKYARAISLWQEWNAKINVISRKDSDCIFEHHILHSLAIAEYVQRFGVLPPETASLRSAPPKSASQISVPPLTVPRVAWVSGGTPQTSLKILDLGTGGGFPGIPLAMEWPEVRFTLCDSIGKKVKVAQSVADGLGLQNVTCVQARAEELPGQWDFVVSRAVAPLDTLYGWVGGKFGGSLICLKGGDVNEEIAVLLRKFRLSPRQVRTWKISDWLDDEYFAEKFVIEVGKSYLCSPFEEK